MGAVCRPGGSRVLQAIFELLLTNRDRNAFFVFVVVAVVVVLFLRSVKATSAACIGWASVGGSLIVSTQKEGCWRVLNCQHTERRVLAGP